MIWLACAILKMQRRWLERQLTRRFDRDLSLQLDRVLVAQEVLGHGHD